MVLNNYFRVKTFFDSHIFNPSGSSISDPNNWTDDIGVIGIDGVNRRPQWGGYPTNYDSQIKEHWCHRINLEIVLGSGNTAVTPTDYALASPINSLSNLSYSITTSSVSGSESSVIIISGTNPTNSSITINEVGVLKNMWCRFPISNPSWSSEWCKILMVRQVLSSPIILEPNENFQLPFEWLEQ